MAGFCVSISRFLARSAARSRRSATAGGRLRTSPRLHHRRLLHSSSPRILGALVSGLADAAPRLTSHLSVAARACWELSHGPTPSLPLRFLSLRSLSTASGGNNNDDGPWKLTPDPDEVDTLFGHDATEDDLLASKLAPGKNDVGETWEKGFADEGGKGELFENLYKEAATPKVGEAIDDWVEGKKPSTLVEGGRAYDVFTAATEAVGEVGNGAFGSDELQLVEEGDVEKRQEDKERERELMEILKGPNRAFGDLIAASGITDDMIDSLILLKDVRNVPGLPPLSEIEDKAIASLNATSGRAEIEKKKQEEIAKARVRQVDEKGRAYGTGKRKCSIARVWIQPGEGKFIVNEKQFDVYFPILDQRAELLRPFTVTKTLGLWDVNCTVKGGGVSGQVGAIRLGISRALQNWEPGLRPYLKAVGYLTRDARVVERKKPGKAKARKSFQWVKR